MSYILVFVPAPYIAVSVAEICLQQYGVNDIHIIFLITSGDVMYLCIYISMLQPNTVSPPLRQLFK